MEPFTMMMLAGAGLGALRGMENEKRMKEHDKYRREVLAMRPWLKMDDPGALQKEGTFGSALQGGVTGGMAAKTFGAPSPFAGGSVNWDDFPLDEDVPAAAAAGAAPTAKMASAAPVTMTGGMEPRVAPTGPTTTGGSDEFFNWGNWSDYDPSMGGATYPGLNKMSPSRYRPYSKLMGFG